MTSICCHCNGTTSPSRHNFFFLIRMIPLWNQQHVKLLFFFFSQCPTWCTCCGTAWTWLWPDFSQCTQQDEDHTFHSSCNAVGLSIDNKNLGAIFLPSQNLYLSPTKQFHLYACWVLYVFKGLKPCAAPESPGPFTTVSV